MVFPNLWNLWTFSCLSVRFVVVNIKLPELKADASCNRTRGAARIHLFKLFQRVTLSQ
jgi:hypothetical protein